VTLSQNPPKKALKVKRTWGHVGKTRKEGEGLVITIDGAKTDFRNYLFY